MNNLLEVEISCLIITFNIFRTILSSMSHFVFPLTDREPINTSAGLCKIMKEKKLNSRNLHNLVKHMLKLMNLNYRKHPMPNREPGITNKLPSNLYL